MSQYQSRYRLPALILLMSLLYIFVIPSDPHAVKLLFKLIPMWLMIAYAYLQIPVPRRRDHVLLVLGLFFCMLGDGLLDWFVVGLTAFLIGHLFYMASFFRNWQFSKIRLATAAPIALFGLFMGRELVRALIHDQSDSLIIPVIFYICVISLMTWSAMMTGNKLAMIGSLLFTVSDSILSWNMFVSAVEFSNVLIMITYYAAQFCIASSIRTLGTRMIPDSRHARSLPR